MKKNEVLSLLDKIYKAGKLSGSWIISGEEVNKAELISNFCHSFFSDAECLSEVKWIKPDLIKKEKDDIIKKIKEGQEIDENQKRKRNAFITVEDIRKGIDFMSLKSIANKNRFLVIDPADLMNVQAQNCLLKMLEEPSEQGVIFLLTNYPEKLLSTITSRCRKIRILDSFKGDLLDFIHQNYPNYNDEVLIKLSFANIDKITKIINNNGLEIYQNMLALSSQTEIYSFVEKYIKDDEVYQMILDFSFVILSEKIEKNLANTTLNMKYLDTWDKLQKLSSDTNNIYLDKKQVLALIIEEVLL